VRPEQYGSAADLVLHPPQLSPAAQQPHLTTERGNVHQNGAVLCVQDAALAQIVLAGAANFEGHNRLAVLDARSPPFPAYGCVTPVTRVTAVNPGRRLLEHSWGSAGRVFPTGRGARSRLITTPPIRALFVAPRFASR